MTKKELLDENVKLKERINKTIEILHDINDDFPLDVILTEVEHAEYVLRGE